MNWIILNCIIDYIQILIVLESCSWSEWIDKDDPTGHGDYESLANCDAEKYEVSLVTGGPVYTNVGLAPQKLVLDKREHGSGAGDRIVCSNNKNKQLQSDKIDCETMPCLCFDYKAKFCCKN